MQIAACWVLEHLQGFSFISFFFIFFNVWGWYPQNVFSIQGSNFLEH